MDLKSIGTLLGTAAAVVGVVFGLFGSVLKDLVPPSTALSPMLYAGIASMAALLVLLAVVLVTPVRPSIKQRRGIMGFAVVMSIAAFFTLFTYVGKLNTFTYYYADPPPANQAPVKYIRGEYTKLGEEITKSRSVAAAMTMLGGRKTVLENQLMWTEQSQNDVEVRLVKHYVLSLTLLNIALFSLVIAVLRSGLVSTKSSGTSKLSQHRDV